MSSKGRADSPMLQEKCLCGVWIVSRDSQRAIMDAMHWHHLHPTHKRFSERNYPRG